MFFRVLSTRTAAAMVPLWMLTQTVITLPFPFIFGESVVVFSSFPSVRDPNLQIIELTWIQLKILRGESGQVLCFLHCTEARKRLMICSFGNLVSYHSSFCLVKCFLIEIQTSGYNLMIYVVEIAGSEQENSKGGAQCWSR